MGAEENKYYQLRYYTSKDNYELLGSYPNSPLAYAMKHSYNRVNSTTYPSVNMKVVYVGPDRKIIKGNDGKIKMVLP